MFNFRNGFFLAVGFSIGYYKGIQHGTRVQDILKEFKDDPVIREAVIEFKESLKNATRETPEDVEGTATDIVVASVSNPATGTDLPPERIAEINASTPENPVIITDDEIKAMNLTHVKVNLGRNRFKIRMADGTIYDRAKVEQARERGDDLPEPVYTIEQADGSVTENTVDMAALAKSKPDPDNPDRPII